MSTETLLIVLIVVLCLVFFDRVLTILILIGMSLVAVVFAIVASGVLAIDWLSAKAEKWRGR